MSRLALQRRLTLFGTLYEDYDQNRATLTQMFVFNVARQRSDLDHMFCMKSHGHTCNQKLNLLTCKNTFRLPHDTEAAPHLPRVLPSDRGGDHHRVPPLPHLGTSTLNIDSQCFLPLHASAHHS